MDRGYLSSTSSAAGTGKARSARSNTDRPSALRPSGHVDGTSLLQIARFTESIKTRLDALMQPAPGRRLLDIGCGPGIDTLRLARAVAPHGIVVGLDADPDMVEMAEARALASTQSPCVTYVVGDAAALPYPAASFDACRCERVLQHVADPALVVSEMTRVTTCGGVVVAADSDWSSLSIHSDDADLERQIVAAVARQFRNGSAGRQLRDLLGTAGLEDIVVEPRCVVWTSYQDFCETSFMSAGVHHHLVANGVIGSADWHRFVRGLETIDARGGFLGTAVLVVASAVKPSVCDAVGA
jgi:SAM-dependent methyltransferase